MGLADREGMLEHDPAPMALLPGKKAARGVGTKKGKKVYQGLGGKAESLWWDSPWMKLEAGEA